MSLWTQKNSSQSPKNDVFGQNLREWQLFFNNVALFIRGLFSSQELIDFVRAMLPHPPRIDVTTAGVAVTVTNKLGQKIVNVVGSDVQVILPNSVFQQHRRKIDDLKAGVNVTLTRKLGQVTINSPVDSDQAILANRVFEA